MKLLKAIWQFFNCSFWPRIKHSRSYIMKIDTKKDVIIAKDEFVVPPAPTDGYVRLTSPFAPDMYHDVALDYFCEVEIDSTDLNNSNHFLLSFWNEMNSMLHPQNSEYVPWYYRPDIVATGKNWKLIMLGDVHTSSGNFHMMLRMKSKSCIKSVLAFNSRVPKEKCQKLFEELVNKAKKNIDRLRSYTSTIRLSCRNADIKKSGIYSGKNFFMRADDKGICLDIRIYAIDYIEAKQQMAKRLDELSAFLSVETNLLFDINNDVEIEENDRQLTISAQSEFIKPFIDGPSVRDGMLLLSEAGAMFLDHYIFVDRDQEEDEVSQYFKRGCTHIYEGLQRQLEKGDRIAYTTRTQSFILSPKENLRSQHIITTAAMNYLSALETASTPEGKPETCPKCGNLTYKISSRVEELVAKYIDNDIGRAFKELYNLRSKYLHAGKLSCDNYYITARPFIDPSTGSGLTDYGFISYRVNGKLMAVGVHNIQELTTYVLRCYYQDKLFGVKDFETLEDPSDDIDPKKMILRVFQQLMPEGIVVEDVTTM